MGCVVDLFPDGPPRTLRTWPAPGAGATCNWVRESNWYWAYRGGDSCQRRAKTTRDGRPPCRQHAGMWDARFPERCIEEPSR
jgi:hypothetical protein